MTDAEFQALRERLVLLPVASAENVHDLRLLVDEARRGRELERACKDYFRRDINTKRFYAPSGITASPASQAALIVIGRLLGEQK